MSKLTKRLRTISDIVSGRVIADVGCDHGKLSEHLLVNNIVEFAYVSDISRDSLQKAIDLLSSHKLNFRAIHTDGLIGYAGIENINECIISGMGGNEIINIIKASPIKIDSFILSPQHNIIETKQFVIENGYRIDYDIIVKDKKKFYTIFKCTKSSQKLSYSKYELMFGKDNFNNKISDIEEYVTIELNKLENLLDRVNDSSKNEISEKIELFKTAKKELKSYE